MRTSEKITRQLAANIGFQQDDIEEMDYDNYGLEVFEIGGEEWSVGTDAEAEKAAAEYIRDSVWAFNADFIAGHIGSASAQSGLAEAIKSLQVSQSEDANDAILEMIEGMGDLDEFVEEVISVDDRGHFLSSYDGEEYEVRIDDEIYYGYRLN